MLLVKALLLHCTHVFLCRCRPDLVDDIDRTDGGSTGGDVVFARYNTIYLLILRLFRGALLFTFVLLPPCRGGQWVVLLLSDMYRQLWTR